MTYDLTFDEQNRITAVKQGGTTIGSFVYDAEGNRVKGTVNGVMTSYVGGLFEWQAGATTKYYDGGAIRRTGYGSGNGIAYVLGDQLGSSTTMVSQAGSALGTNYYYPFGGNRGGSAFSDLTTKRFTGQYHEKDLPGGEGLSYYNARWYDPQLGRFASPDTIVPGTSNPQAFNRYAYVNNSPVNHIDPSGHRACRNQDDCYESGETPMGRDSRSARKAIQRWKSHGGNYTKKHKMRVYYLNAIGLGKKRGTIAPSDDPTNEQGSYMYAISYAAGAGNAKHIPVYYGDDYPGCDITCRTRADMILEAYFEKRIWSDKVANEIANDLKANPALPDERLVLVGNSGGGTLAIEALDLLGKSGIKVDQVILRGSLVQEVPIGNVRRVDYITSNGIDHYYSKIISLSPNATVHEHRAGNFGHTPVTDQDREAVTQVLLNTLLTGEE